MPKRKKWDSKIEAEEALPLWLRNKGHVVAETKYVRLNGSIGAAVRWRREAAGMSLRSLAQWMNISHTHLSNLETGSKPWSNSRLHDATSILDMHEERRAANNLLG